MGQGVTCESHGSSCRILVALEGEARICQPSLGNGFPGSETAHKNSGTGLNSASSRDLLTGV